MVLVDIEILEREARKSTNFRYSKLDDYILIRDLSKSISYIFELNSTGKRKVYGSIDRTYDSLSDDSATDSPRSPRGQGGMGGAPSSNHPSFNYPSSHHLVRITNDSPRPYMKYLFDRHSVISMIAGNMRVLGMLVDIVSITQPTTTPASLTIGEFKYEYTDTTPLFNMREIRITFKKSSREKADLDNVVINRTGRCEFITIFIANSSEPLTLLIKHQSTTSEDPISYADVSNVSGLIPANYTNKQWRAYTADIYNGIIASEFYKHFMY